MVELDNWHRIKDRVAVYIPTYNERGVLKSEIQITGKDLRPNASPGSGKSIAAVIHIDYNEKGQRLTLKLGNDTTTSYFYDKSNFRLLRIRTTRPTPNTSNLKIAKGLKDYGILQDLNYTYDAVGNISHIDDKAQAIVFENGEQIIPTSHYTYDALNRLISAAGRENKNFNTAPTNLEPVPITLYNGQAVERFRMYRQQYRYDAAGNILEMRHFTKNSAQRWTRDYTYDPNSNHLKRTATQAGTPVEYNYDLHGSMLNYITTSTNLNWDYRDHLNQLPLGGGGAAYYQYDSSLERTYKRIEKGLVEERFYLGGMELYLRWANGFIQEEIETHHLMVDDQRVLLIDDVITTNSQLNAGTLYQYQYSNHLGSVALELNQSAAIVSYEEYHPYGTVAYHAEDALLKMVSKRYRYTGMERDKETGLNYHSARYYLPWLGRWLSADPIGIEDGINTYSNTHNNPVRFIDINGKQSTQTQGRIYENQVQRDRHFVVVADKEFISKIIKETFRLVTTVRASSSASLDRKLNNLGFKIGVLFLAGHGGLTSYDKIWPFQKQEGRKEKKMVAKDALRLRDNLESHSKLLLCGCHTAGLSDKLLDGTRVPISLGRRIQKILGANIEVIGNYHGGDRLTNIHQFSEKSKKSLVRVFASNIQEYYLSLGEKITLESAREIAIRVLEPIKRDDVDKRTAVLVARVLGSEKFTDAIIGVADVDIADAQLTQLGKERFLKGIEQFREKFKVEVDKDRATREE